MTWRNPHTGKPEPESHAATLEALEAEKRRPTEADAPPLSTFPGGKARPLPGQLDISEAK